MMVIRPVGFGLLAAILACAGWVGAEEPAPPTLEQLKIAQDELPAGWSFVEGLPGATPALEALIRKPDQDGVLPVPVATATQAIATSAMRSGVIAYFQYEKALPDLVRTALPRILWGEDQKTAAERPQEIVHYGPYVLILGFPQESEETEWIKDRLRRKFKAKVARVWKDLKPLMGHVMGLYHSGDIDQARSMLQTNQERIRNYSFGQYMYATLSGKKKDWVTAEGAFRRAIELHETDDPLPGRDSMLWAAQDGLGLALAVQGKFEAAVPPLTAAQALAVKLDSPDAIGKTEYNLACVYSELGRFEEAFKTLEHCIEVKPSTKADARKDSSFAKAREREDFKSLLAE